MKNNSSQCEKLSMSASLSSGDVPTPVWPESPGFGLYLGGSGSAKSQAKPNVGLGLAWLWLRLGLYNIINTKIILSLIIFST